jgi:UPF0042 nucleotide-binding protein
MTADPGSDHRLILVTGPSGAGRTTAIRALEDLGYEGIDNIPLSLVPRLTDGPPLERPVAIGLDVRNRDFNANALCELIDGLTRDPRVSLDVLYLDCAPGVLIHRFSETRRRHPLAPNETPAQGVEREIDILTPIRVRADHLIDTTDLNQHDLKAEIASRFDIGPSGRMSVSVQSFSYKRGVPRGVDMIFDCRFLANPHWTPALRALDGCNPQVEAFVRADPRFPEFFGKVTDLLLFLLPAHLAEGKAHLAIGFGCTGGQHRSVAMAELVGNALAEAGWAVSKRHRELERRVAETQPGAAKVAGA